MAQSDSGKILIVDDEPIQIRVLSEALEGFEIRFATDGSRALSLATEQAFDLILLDVVMPGIDGFEVLRWLKSEPRTAQVPVILVSAMSEDEDEQKGLTLGAADYISKPVRPAILRARVATQVALKRQGDQLRTLLPQDPLTGLAPRSRFIDELDRAWGRAQRHGTELGLMRMGIDHYDRFLAEYGQSPAEECVRRLAQALEAAFSRGEDLLARVADDEFALLIDGPMDIPQVRRALAAAARLEIPHARSARSPFVSLSIGALSLLVSARTNTADCLAQTAQLLQRARDAGGGQGIHQRLPGEHSQTVALPESSAVVQADVS